MRKEKEEETDGMEAEYHLDYSKAEWGKFAGKVQRTKSVIYIDHDIAAAFKDSDSVNQALRQVIALGKLTLPKKPVAKKHARKSPTKTARPPAI